MKKIVNISSILVGTLFVFSGFIKAIDPLGLSYKMQEFYEVWAAQGFLPGMMNFLHQYSLASAILMIAFEWIAGIALLAGWQKKLTTWLLFLLTIFFTFLTSYVLFSGKIRACGCLGECIPLTPIQTFSKDIALTILIIWLLIGRNYIKPVLPGFLPGLIVFVSAVFIFGVQFYVLKHLPLWDCLHYKKGNNIIELSKTPADATFDKYDYKFVYQKDGVKKEFTMNNIPDSTWQFVDQEKTLIEKGNGKTALITDFSLSGIEGNDTTEAVLNQPCNYYLFFIMNLNKGTDYWIEPFQRLLSAAEKQSRKIYIVTSDRDKLNDFINVNHHFNLSILTCDATALKTAARTDLTPVVFLMNGPVIEGKWSWADMDHAYNQ